MGREWGKLTKGFKRIAAVRRGIRTAGVIDGVRKQHGNFSGGYRTEEDMRYGGPFDSGKVAWGVRRGNDIAENKKAVATKQNPEGYHEGGGQKAEECKWERVELRHKGRNKKSIGPKRNLGVFHKGTWKEGLPGYDEGAQGAGVNSNFYSPLSDLNEETVQQAEGECQAWDLGLGKSEKGFEEKRAEFYSGTSLVAQKQIPGELQKENWTKGPREQEKQGHRVRGQEKRGHGAGEQDKRGYGVRMDEFKWEKSEQSEEKWHGGSGGGMGVNEFKEHNRKQDKERGHGSDLGVQIQEIKFREEVSPCSLVLDVHVGGKVCEAVIDSGAQVTVLNRRVFEGLEKKPKVGRRVRLKGPADDNVMMADVIEEFRIGIGGTYCNNRVFIADISDECILGLDTMKLFKMVIDLDKGIVGVNGKVLPGRLKYVGGEEIPLYPARSVGEVRLEPESVSRIQIRLEGKPQGELILEPGFPDCRFFMPSVVLEGEGVGQIWVVNDSREKMLIPEGTLMGMAQESGQEEVIEGTVGRVKGGAELPGHLVEMFDRAKVGLTGEQAKDLEGMLCKYGGVFAEHDMDLGSFSAVKHKIDTGDARPIKQRPRRTPLAFEGEEREHLQKLLDAGIISRGASEWASPTVLVRKKDGGVRYCIDMRGVNSVTIKDRFPLPRISECIDALGGCEYFSCLDMANGYYQIKMDEEDRDKTAFVTKYGQFLFNRMPFGLSNAPGTFSRALGLVLRGLSWACVVSFLDDLVVLGKGFEDHMVNLGKVFGRFQQFGLKLKPKKCELLQREILFLGHRVSREGVQPSASKVEQVREWVAPNNKRELEGFLGLVNFYREYIKDFAHVAAPLHRLTGSKVKFQWGEEEGHAFQALKEKITEAPCLVFPREGGGFILDTDASDRAVGAVLSQVQEGRERVVGYGSFVLNAAQRNYCVTRRELLAIVVFTKHFRHYLLGGKFKVRTDHSSLIWLMKFKNIEGQLARWIEELQTYDMEVEFRPGREHGNADGLSRIPMKHRLCRDYKPGVELEQLPCGGCKFCTRIQEKWGAFEEEVDDVVPLAIRAVEVGGGEKGWVEGFTCEDLKRMQEEDQEIATILGWRKAGCEPDKGELMLSSPGVKYWWTFRDNLRIRNGVLMYAWKGGGGRLLLVAPKELKVVILDFCHSSGGAGHFGVEKTKLKVLEGSIWHKLRDSCEEWVGGCAICNRQKKGDRKNRGRQQLFHAGYPLERVHIDIMGPLITTGNGNKYVLVIVDQFTKWVEAYPVKDQQAETVAKVVVREFIGRYGCPMEIHTDQGRNFESGLFKGMCEIMGIKKTRTTSFRPSANGQVERYNRSIAQIIRCYVGDKQEKWDEYLGLATSAIRATVNRATGFTPNRLMLGREVMKPLDLMLGNRGELVDGGTIFGTDLKLGWEEAHEKAREQLGESQRRQKKYYDLRKREVEFQVGEAVLKRNNAAVVGGSKKLNAIWKGIWVINKVISAVLYEIKNNKKSMVVHHDAIKKCGDSELPPWVIRLKNRIKEREEARGHEEVSMDSGGEELGRREGTVEIEGNVEMEGTVEMEGNGCGTGTGTIAEEGSAEEEELHTDGETGRVPSDSDREGPVIGLSGEDGWADSEASSGEDTVWYEEGDRDKVGGSQESPIVTKRGRKISRPHWLRNYI